MSPTPTSPDLQPLVRRFIEEGGKTTQALGIGRVLGQIYAYLYFSPVPRNLGDLQRALGISKASASTGVRQLEQWEAVRQVWVKGDRKDYYEANDWFGRIFRRAVLDTIGNRLSSYAVLLEEAEQALAAESGDGEETAFVRKRMAHVRSFQGRAQKLWNNPMLKRMLR